METSSRTSKLWTAYTSFVKFYFNISNISLHLKFLSNNNLDDYFHAITDSSYFFVCFNIMSHFPVFITGASVSVLPLKHIIRPATVMENIF